MIIMLKTLKVDIKKISKHNDHPQTSFVYFCITMNVLEYNEELSNLYHGFYEKSRNDILTGRHSIDETVDQPIDNRRGLSLIVRPARQVQKSIKRFTNELAKIDNNQYYQPCSDMHITVLSIISCQENFKIDQIEVEEYIDIISDSLEGIKEIAIHSKGATTSRDAVMIQGFMLNDNLVRLRDRLRVNFRKSTLKQDIDRRYLTKTAHITAARFRKEIINPVEFINVVDDYKDFDFGITAPTTIDLIYTDWFCKQSKIELLHQFAL